MFLDKQDWHSPVSSNELEYICWHSLYPPRCTDALEFPVRICDASHITTHTHKTYLIYPMIAISETPGLSITFGTLLACRWRIIEPSLAAFIGFPFAVLFTCTFTECVTLRHEVHELDGYDHEFWKNSGHSLKFVLELIASTLHAKSLQRHHTQLGSREHLRRLRFSLAY